MGLLSEENRTIIEGVIGEQSGRPGRTRVLLLHQWNHSGQVPLATHLSRAQHTIMAWDCGLLHGSTSRRQPHAEPDSISLGAGGSDRVVNVRS